MLRYVGDLKYCGANKFFKIRKIPFFVGRSSNSDLVLTCLDISRSHCIFSKLYGDGDVWMVECLSENGLWVDDHILQKGEKKLLQDENLIKLSDNVYMLFKSHCFFAQRASIELVDAIDGPSSKMPPHKACEESSAIELGCSAVQGIVTMKENVCSSLQAGDPSEAKFEAVEATTLKLDSEVELSNLRKTLGMAEKHFLQAEEQNTDLQQRMKTVESKHTDEISKAKAEIVEILATRVKLEEEMKNLQQLLLQAEIQVHQAKEQNTDLQQRLSATESLHADEISKAKAEIAGVLPAQIKLEEQMKNLQQLLHQAEMQARESEKRNANLEQEMQVAASLHTEELLKTNIKTAKIETKADLLSQELTKVQEEKARAVTELNAAEQRITSLGYEAIGHEARAALKDDEIGILKARLCDERQTSVAAKLDTTEVQTSLRAVEEENKSLRLEIIAVQAMSSSLSDDVERYKRYWEETEQKNFAAAQEKVKLTEEIAGLKDKLDNGKTRKVLLVKEVLPGLRKVPDLAREVNSAKEAACAQQMKEFEEFVETDLQCAICFELVIAATALNCGHTFCDKCVREWQARSANCPTCRVSITTLQRCKMLDSFIARAAGKLSEDFRARRREATGGRGTDSQGQLPKKRARKENLRGSRVRQPNFDLPGPEPLPEAQFFVDLT